MTLTAMEFLRRFVQHILPRGFVRIRQFGYLANTCRAARLPLARRSSPPNRCHRGRRRRPPRRLALSALWGRMTSGPSSRRALRPPHWASIPHDCQARPSRPAHLGTSAATSPELLPRRRRPIVTADSFGCASASVRHARPPTASPTTDARVPLRGSIAGRPATGFLQVSLSKVPRHPRRPRPSSRAEALPMNASDLSLAIRGTRLREDAVGCRASQLITAAAGQGALRNVLSECG